MLRFRPIVHYLIDIIYYISHKFIPVYFIYVIFYHKIDYFISFLMFAYCNIFTEYINVL